MNRILEYAPASEDAAVSRILIMVHKAVDTNFPNAQDADRQFTKTVFSTQDHEPTALNKVPEGDEASHSFRTPIDTDEIPAADDDSSKDSESEALPQTSALNPMRDHLESEPSSRIATQDQDRVSKADWISRGLFALILVALVFLAVLLLNSPA